LVTTSGNEWNREHGPNRPVWEPVRLVDFDGERLEALKTLRDELRNEALSPEMNDHRLALHAILEILFTQATVSGPSGAAELTRLANSRLPEPQRRGARRRLTPGRRDELIVVAGQMWQVFTAHNFPLTNNMPEN
jgi:hypothetical protein